jgi:hypothetical protein
MGAGGERGLFLRALLALALGACRQTVVLDEMGTDGGNEGTGETKDDGAGTAGCNAIAASPRLPEFMIALDHSNAMNPPFGSSPSRLLAMQAEIQKILERFQTFIWFGYEEFPTSNPNACGNASGCCAGDLTPPSFGFDALNRALFACTSAVSGTDECAYPFGQRPMADALAQIGGIFTPSNNPNSHHRYVLLIAGGDANCGDGAGGSSNCPDANNQASSLRIASHVNTFVLGIGNDVSSSNCLDNIAQAGGFPVGGNSPFYYLARTQTDLDRDMGDIMGQVASDACQMDLDRPPSDPNKVQVSIGSDALGWIPVPFDRFNGWGYSGSANLEITLNGDACTNLVDLPNPQVQVLSGPGCGTRPQ